jgi:hypothetical protein
MMITSSRCDGGIRTCSRELIGKLTLFRQVFWQLRGGDLLHPMTVAEEPRL